MAVCMNCGQQGGELRFCVNCGASLAQQETRQRSASVDRRLIIGIAAAGVVVALVTVGVLVFVNRSPSAGGDATRASGTAASADSPSTSGASAGASAVTIGSGSVLPSARSTPTGPSQTVSATALSSTSTAGDSVDDQGNPITYAPANAVDGDPTTAWRASTGDGVGQELVLQLPGTYLLTSVGLSPGYDKVDAKTGTDRFRQNRRISSVTWTFDDGSTVAQNFKDDRAVQVTAVNVITRTVHIRITSSLPPADTTDPRDFVAISDVSFQGLPT